MATTQELYKIARDQELQEFYDVAKKMESFQMADEDEENYLDLDALGLKGVYEPVVSACPRHHDHPADFRLRGFDANWNELIMDEVEWGESINVSPSEIEYSHLMYVTEFFEAILNSKKKSE